MKDWLFIVLVSIAGYIFIYSCLEYQRLGISSQIDEAFKNQGNHQPFFEILGETQEPSNFFIQIFIAAGVLGFYGKVILKNILIRTMIYTGPIIFIFQLVLLENDIKSLPLILITYLIAIIITFVLSKHQEIFAAICSGIVFAYFMFFLMTFDQKKLNQKVGITSIVPVYLSGILFNVAIGIYAYGNLQKKQLAAFKRYVVIQTLVFFISVLYLGFFNVHLYIAGQKMLNHSYDSHVEHYIIYLGSFLTFVLGGGLLANFMIWVQTKKALPYFLTDIPFDKEEAKNKYPYPYSESCPPPDPSEREIRRKVVVTE